MPAWSSSKGWRAKQKSVESATSTPSRRARTKPRARRICTIPPSHSRLLTESAEASHITPPTAPHPQLIGLHLRQKHPSGLDDVLMNPPALPSAFVLPAMDGAFVEVQSSNDGLNRAAVCQQDHYGGDQLVRLVRPVECGRLVGVKVWPHRLQR